MTFKHRWPLLLAGVAVASALSLRMATPLAPIHCVDFETINMASRIRLLIGECLQEIPDLGFASPAYAAVGDTSWNQSLAELQTINHQTLFLLIFKTIAQFGYLALIIWAFIDCVRSRTLDKTSKILWGLLLLLFSPSVIVYAWRNTTNRILRRVSFHSIPIIFAMFLIVLLMAYRVKVRAQEVRRRLDADDRPSFPKVHPKVHAIEVHLSVNGMITVNNVPCSKDMLASALRSQLAGQSTPIVVIRSDVDVGYAQVGSVLATVQNLGVANLRIVTEVTR